MTMTNQDQVRLNRIAKTYAPYDKFVTFWDGVEDYLNGVHRQWRDRLSGVNGQAYDRGMEAAMRLGRGEGNELAPAERAIRQARYDDACGLEGSN